MIVSLEEQLQSLTGQGWAQSMLMHHMSSLCVPMFWHNSKQILNINTFNFLKSFSLGMKSHIWQIFWKLWNRAINIWLWITEQTMFRHLIMYTMNSWNEINKELNLCSITLLKKSKKWCSFVPRQINNFGDHSFA